MLVCSSFCFEDSPYFQDGYGSGIVVKLLMKIDPVEIPYERLSELLDLEGPYRHIFGP